MVKKRNHMDLQNSEMEVANQRDIIHYYNKVDTKEQGTSVQRQITKSTNKHKTRINGKLC